jgi:hypothetical protein
MQRRTDTETLASDHSHPKITPDRVGLSCSIQRPMLNRIQIAVPRKKPDFDEFACHLNLNLDSTQDAL